MAISADSNSPLVVIAGATGLQGGSVIRNLVESDKPYRLRGLTRDSSKASATKLKELGVEVVSVTIAVGNEAAVRKAFEGAEIVFAVTNYWEHSEKAREISEGKLMVDAAKAVDAKLFVWSGLESFTKGTGGKYTRVYQFDSKAEVTEYAFSQLPTVDVQAGFYMTNLVTTFPPRKLADGSFVWDFPLARSHHPLPYIDVEHDYGLFVRYAIETPEFRQGGRSIYTYGEHILNSQAATILQRARGIKLRVEPLPLGVHLANLKADGTPPLALEVFEDLLSAVQDFGGLYFGKEFSAEQHEIRKRLPRRPRTFEEFLSANPGFFN